MDKLIFTNDNCTGCNKCVRACPVLLANNASVQGIVTVNTDNVLRAEPALMFVPIMQGTLWMIRTSSLPTLLLGKIFQC